MIITHSFAVHQIHHIALKFGDVIVDGAAGAHGIGQGVWGTALVIPEVQNLRAAVALHGVPQELSAGVDIAVRFCSGSLGNGPASPHTACIVGILPIAACAAGRGQMLICGPEEIQQLLFVVDGNC